MIYANISVPSESLSALQVAILVDAIRVNNIMRWVLANTVACCLADADGHSALNALSRTRVCSSAGRRLSPRHQAISTREFKVRIGHHAIYGVIMCQRVGISR
jgi:hypothetical protein